MAEKHRAPLTSYDAFFHGLGHQLPYYTGIGMVRCTPESGPRGLVAHPASRVRLLGVWSITRGAGPGWGGCNDPSGARVERGGRAQAGADDALTKTWRGAGSACADHPARG